MDPDKRACRASLGIIEKEDFKRLKASGVSLYHHNLETARSHFKSICTTHTYNERIESNRLKKPGFPSVPAVYSALGKQMTRFWNLPWSLNHWMWRQGTKPWHAPSHDFLYRRVRNDDRQLSYRRRQAVGQ